MTDHLTIDNSSPTETNIATDLVYGKFSNRLLATFFDATLIAIIFGPIFVMISEKLHKYFNRANDLNELHPKIYILYNITNISAQIFIFFIVTIILWKLFASTPGKMLFKLKIVDKKTLGPASLWQLILRFICYPISILPLGLGIVWIDIDKKYKQAWHDKIARTLVIKK